MTSPNTPSRALTALVVTLCALLGLCVGGVGGVVAGHTTAKLATPDPLGPTALPELPEKFPATDDMYLPGVTVSFITKDFLRQAKWICETRPPNPKRYGGEASLFTSCHAPQSSRLRVHLWHDGEAKVRTVVATCPSSTGFTPCRTLVSAIAELTVVGQPDLATRAAAWAADNVDRDATTVIGEVRLVAALEPLHEMAVVPAE